MSITIGGDAGQGIESSGAGFAKALARGGLHVFTLADYRSRIRGGHNFYQVRAATRPVYSHSDPVHVLLAMTEETVKVHLGHVHPGGVIVYDEDFRRVDPREIEARGVTPLPLPLARMAQQRGSKVMMNTLALGVAAGLLGFPVEPLESVIRDNFGKKGGKVVEANLSTVRDGHRLGSQHAHRLPWKLPTRQLPPRMLLHGNHAFGLGAVAAGLRFMAAYPMTPGTSLFEWVVAHADRLGIVTKHAEDEIAALCMAIGAAHAGARAMTSTSGGGFSLMTEALGLAGMTETPVVIYEAQRGGPSTGLPTRTEQGDLLFVLHASQGEFPRIVLAPGTVEQAFEAGWRAFNLAERYQCPVIVLSDQFLASSLRDVPLDALRLEDVVIDRGELLDAARLEALTEPYLRYRDTPSGVSPRAVPGHPRAVYAITGDEHDEEGHITEEIQNRRQQMDKRMRKLAAAAAEMRGPGLYGPPQAEVTLVCWGSTYGPCREAADLLAAEGLAVNVLHFTDLWPLPVEAASAALAGTRYALCVEQNYTGQLARLLRMTTGFAVHGTLNKFDGRPFSPQEIAGAVRERVMVRA